MSSVHQTGIDTKPEYRSGRNSDLVRADARHIDPEVTGLGATASSTSCGRCREAAPRAGLSCSIVSASRPSLSCCRPRNYALRRPVRICTARPPPSYKVVSSANVRPQDNRVKYVHMLQNLMLVEQFSHKSPAKATKNRRVTRIKSSHVKMVSARTAKGPTRPSSSCLSNSLAPRCA